MKRDLEKARRNERGVRVYSPIDTFVPQPVRRRRRLTAVQRVNRSWQRIKVRTR